MSTPISKLFDLTGQVALVTGGSRGLGLQMAEALGEMGAKLAITARKADELAEAKKHLEAQGYEVLTVVMSEFGRTPTINRNFGRDHWGTAWSVAMGGCGIQKGAVVGKTNATGTAVVDREVNGGHLFHTYLKALGFDSKKNFYVDQRPLPMADPKASPIEEILL